jgi:hypothetical protein
MTLIRPTFKRAPFTSRTIRVVFGSLLAIAPVLISLSASPAAYATAESPYIIYQGHANSAVSPHNSTSRFVGVIFGSNGYDLYVGQNGEGIEKLDTRSLVPGDSTTATFSNFDLSSGVATQSAGFAVSSDGQFAYASGANSNCAIIKFNLFVPSNSCFYPGSQFENIEISPNDGFVYVAGEQRVYKVNTTNGQKSGEITNPGFFGLSSAISGSHLYLYNYYTGHMFEINTETFELSGDYVISPGGLLGQYGEHLSIVGNNIYLSSYSSSQGYVVKYDVTTHLTSRINVRMGALSTIDLFSLQVSTDGNFGWFIDQVNSKVSQISLTGSDAGTIRSSIAMPETSLTAGFLSINSTGSLAAYSSRKNNTQWLTVISAGQFVVSAIDPVATAQDPVVAAKAAAEVRARAVEVAKTEIKNVLSSGKPLTADQLLSADFNGVTSKNIGLVNADIAKLLDADKTDLKQIEKVVLKFATVDKLAEGKTVYSSDLITVGLIPQDSKIKSSITSALKKLPTSSLDTFEKIQAEIASVEKVHADRKARLAAILDKQKR